MARRIFRNIALVSVLAVLLSAALIVPTLYRAYEESMCTELMQEARIIAGVLQNEGDEASFLQTLPADSRITLIAPDGEVLFDNWADALHMENHARRPEIQQALQNGAGQSTRASDTLSEITLYCALRTNDGKILRIGSTRRSIIGTFVNMLPLIGGMLMGIALLSILIARKAARKIVEPINALDLDHPLENEAYDELAPLLTRMHRQREEIKQHMQALESARAELAAIMANMREGMVLLSQEQTVLSMNESAARIFNIPAERAIGQKLCVVDRSADLAGLTQRCLAGQRCSIDMQRGERQYELFINPVLCESGVRGIVILVLDVTERYAAEKSRREFTANVSHELKTPLTSISGFAEIIRDGIAQPQDIPHFAGMICKESARLIALVNDILELSRLDEKQGLPAWESVSLQPLLGALVQDLSLAAQKKRLNVRLSCEECAVCGDPILLRELFFNLLDNAIKYTPEGGCIDITAAPEGGKIACAVSDSGIGIPAEHLPHIFERFYRVDKSHSRQTGGTGLGLAIVKHIALLHGAQLELSSKEGRGTKISVRFPLSK